MEEKLTLGQIIVFSAHFRIISKEKMDLCYLSVNLTRNKCYLLTNLRLVAIGCYVHNQPMKFYDLFLWLTALWLSTPMYIRVVSRFNIEKLN